MKAYKVFNNDWTCKGFQYKIGETYEIEGEISLCNCGFHACKNLADCFQYYDCVQWNKIAEVELLGDIIGENRDKQVTNKIKIIKEILFDEIAGIIKEGVNDSEGVNRSEGVNDSEGVNRSEGVNDSEGVNLSKGVNHSEGVNGSKGVNHSEGVNLSKGVNRSEGVNLSKGVNRSEGVNDSEGVNRSEGVNDSEGVSNSQGVSRSKGVSYSQGVHWSYGVFNSSGICNALFLADKKANYIVFGIEVSRQQFDEYFYNLQRLLGGWCPTYNNLRSLYLKSGSDWKQTPIPQAQEIQTKEAWSDMPQEAIDYIKSWKEFNAKMFKKITGIDTKEV